MRPYLQGRSSPAPSQVEFSVPLQYDDPIELWPSSSLDPSGSVFDLGLFTDAPILAPAAEGRSLEFDTIEARSETDEIIIDEPMKDLNLARHNQFLPSFPTPSRRGQTSSMPPNGFSLLSFSNLEPATSSTTAVDEVLAAPSRKRRRLEKTLSDLSLPEARKANDLTLLSDQLVSLDSDQFQEYVSEVERTRSLSKAEQEIIKVVKRRILNRESARRSRQERKDQVGLMEDRIDQLCRELQETKLEAAQLSAQNAAMRDEIAFSQSLIHSNPVLQQLYEEVRMKHEAKRASANGSSTDMDFSFS